MYTVCNQIPAIKMFTMLLCHRQNEIFKLHFSPFYILGVFLVEINLYKAYNFLELYVVENGKS